MDIVLLVLALTERPLLASEIAAIVDSPSAAVRATLARLDKAGFATPTKVARGGPVGTYAWRASREGEEAVMKLAKWLKGPRS